MKKYILIWDCNNGYSCRCCGKTWEETEISEFESQQEAIEYAKSRENDERQLQMIARIGKEIQL